MRYAAKILGKMIFSAVAIIVFFLPTFSCANSEIFDKPVRILIINSYHKGYPWTDEQTDALERRLRFSLPDASLDVVYLDWKRHPTRENLDLNASLLRTRYGERGPDAVVTTDDAALSFALALRSSWKPTIPIVFSGIFEYSAPILIGDAPNVSGVYEILDPEGTIKLAQSMNSAFKKVYLVHDSSETSLAFEEEVRRIIARTTPVLELVVLRGLSFETLRERLAAVPLDGFVLLGSYASDANGLTLAPTRFASLLAQSSAVPVFTVYRYLLGTGVVGGSLLSGANDGEIAAQIIASALTSVQPARPMRPKAGRTVGIDFNEASRFRLDLHNLPYDAVVINKPLSFAEQYPEIAIGGSAVIIVLTVLVVSLLFNIAQRKRMQQELRHNYDKLLESRETSRRNEERYRMALESTRDVIWEWDVAKDTRVFSDRLKLLIGERNANVHSVDEWFALMHPEDRDAVWAAFNRYLARETPTYSTTYRVRRDDGSYIWLQANAIALFDEQGKAYYMLGSYTDVTHEMEHHRHLDFLAFHDALTGLPNRVKLQTLTDEAIAARSPDGIVVLLFIDLDNFKYVNDSFGHRTGDDLLVAVARRIGDAIDDAAVLARLGGDEFVVLCSACTADLPTLESTVRSAFIAPFDIGGQHFYISFSAGIAVAPEDGITFDELLMNADTAMYRSKGERRGRFVRFTSEMNLASIERLRLHNRLRMAVETGAFSLHYQPQVDSQTGMVRGFEALLRWTDPELGTVPPLRFIPACEESGLITRLGEWVLAEASAMARRLNEGSDTPLTVAVNVSVVQLLQGDFCGNAVDIVRRAGASPDMLELEVTESLMMDALETGVRRLNHLSQAGFRIALDDFGSGYSSLNYLRRLPIQMLKLDKAFIDRLPSDPGDSRLIESLIHMARDMNLEVVAEGVESVGQRDALRGFGCHWLQGYLIGRPMPAEGAQRFLAEWPGFGLRH